MPGEEDQDVVYARMEEQGGTTTVEIRSFRAAGAGVDRGFDGADNYYSSFLPVGLVQTPSQLTTGFVVKVETNTCVLTSRRSLATARQADRALIIFVMDSDRADEPVVSCQLRPKVFFQVVGDMVLCGMDWKALDEYSIRPLTVADRDFVQRRVHAGSRLSVLAHCLGNAERRVYDVHMKEVNNSMLRYDTPIPDGCAGGAVLCDDVVVGVHVQNSFETAADTAAVLYPLLQGVQVSWSSVKDDMARLIGAIRDFNALTLKKEVENEGVEAVKAICTDDGRDLVFMSAFHGSLACLTYLLDTFGAEQYVNKRYKRGMGLAHVAALRGHVHVLQHLLDRGCNMADVVNDYGDNVAHMAAGADHVPVILWLSKAAPDTLTTENKMGYMAAHLAASRNCVRVLNCLAYDCRVLVVGDKAINSKGRGPLDEVEEGDHYLSRAMLKDLQARRARLYKNAEGDGGQGSNSLPTFSAEFEAVYESSARPFSRGRW